MRRSRWLGPYRLLHRIASGGMAEIYRARLIAGDGTQHDVALKRLLPAFNEDNDFIVMLTDEARITARLDHPNIAQIYEFGVVEDQHILSMEFIDGVDLRAAIRRAHERDDDFPVAVSVQVVEQALRGLHCAHDLTGDDGKPSNVVHRDFSPSNILVGFNGDVKLIDFGIAKARLNRTRTRGGIIKGKIKYMSPEQTLGKRLDRRSDVFAAGVVLYYAITGTLPFYAPQDAALMVAIREQQPDPPSAHSQRVDTDFDQILMKALAKDPSDRHATAEAFADALRVWLVQHDPMMSSGQVGRLLERLFARERMEMKEVIGELERGLGHDDRTPTHQAVQYTRLVDVGQFTGTGEICFDPGAEIDAWLARRRTDTRGHQKEPTHEIWASSPPYLDPNQTQEMERIELTPHSIEGDTVTSRYVPDETTTRRSRDSD